MDTKKAVKDASGCTLAATEVLRAPAAAPLVPLPLEVLVPEARQQTPAVGQRAHPARLPSAWAWPDQVHRRLLSAGHALRQDQAGGHRVGAHHQHRHERSGGDARCRGRAHGQATFPATRSGRRSRISRCWPTTRVFHAGDGVAAVAAVTEQIATEALEKIKVEYELLTPVLDPLEVAAARNAGRARAESECLLAQGHQEGRHREGVRGIRPDLRSHLSHPDGRARAARAALVAGDVGCQRPRHDLFHARAASRSAAPTSRARWAFR